MKRRGWLSLDVPAGLDIRSLFILLALPLVVPSLGLALRLSPDPIPLVSGLMLRMTGGLLPGYPWVDPNAGFTTQALGRLVADSWLHGQIPWWNSYSGPGLPLAAEYQPGAFFLPFVLLLHFDGGGTALRVVLQIIAGLATFALLRQLTLCRSAALLGGCLFELNGTFAWFLDAPIQPLPFLPMLLLGLERAGIAAAARLRGGWGFITIALAFSLLAGFPETALLDGLLGLGWAIRRCWATPAVGRTAYVFKVALGGSAALLIAAPQLVPFLEYLTQAPAALHGGRGEAGLPTASALTFLMPYAMGPIHAFSGYDPTGTLNIVWGNIGGYFGTTLVFVAAVGALSQRAPRGLRGLLALWLAIWVGRIFAVRGPTQLVNLVPGLSQVAAFRYVEGSCCMALVILAAFAADGWRHGRGAPRVALAGAALGVVLASALSLKAAAPILAHLAPVSFPYLPLSIAASAALFMLLALLLVSRPTPARATALGLVMVAEALALFLVPVLSGTRDFQIDTEAVAFLRQHLGLQRVYSLGPLAPNYGAFYRVPQLNNNMTPYPASWARFIASDLDPGAPGDLFTGTHPQPVAQRTAALRANLENFAAAATRFVAAPAGLDPLTDKIPSDIRLEGNVPRGLQAGEALSGTWATHHAPIMADAFEVMIGTFGGRSDGDLSVEVCTSAGCARGRTSTVRAADNRLRLIRLSSPLAIGSGDTVRWTLSYSGGQQPVAIWYFPGLAPEAPLQPNMTLVHWAANTMPKLAYSDPAIDIYEIEGAKDYFTADNDCSLDVHSRERLSARCPSAATLTRRELFYPGWRASVNGRAVPVGAAGPVFQAIDLPAGMSEIAFTFRPRFSALMWIATLLGLVGAVALQRRV